MHNNEMCLSKIILRVYVELILLKAEQRKVYHRCKSSFMETKYDVT